MKYKQGFFKPRNPEKYKGDPTNITYRSQWELKFMAYIDNHPNVIWWKSEEVIVPYRSPIDNKIHRYFPDFVIFMINKDGRKETVMIEIKPKSQTLEPIKQSKKTKKYINEVYTWGINQAKWKAAAEYCADRGWKFQIMTEDHLGIR